MLHLLLTLGIFPIPQIEPAPVAEPSAAQESDGLNRQTSTGTAVEDPHYEEFVETLRFYENALESYDFDVRKLRRRKAPKEDYPIPPEYTFYDSFKELSEKGSVWSMSWLVENLSVRHREEADLVRETQAWYHRMFEEGRNSNAILRPVERLPLAWEALGADFILSELATLFEKSTHRGVRGNALYAQGRTLILSSKDGDEASVQADANTLYAQLLDGFPQSPMVGQAAMALYPSVMKNFEAVAAEWIAQVEALSVKGVPFEEWPERPGAEFADRFMTLIGGQMMQAKHWMQSYWVDGQGDYENFGLAQGLCGDALRLGSLSSVSNSDWLPHMFDLLTPLTRTFQNEPWFKAWLVDAVNQIVLRRVRSEIAVPGFEGLLSVVTDDDVRQCYSYALGDACLRLLPKPDLKRAESLFRGVSEAFGADQSDQGFATIGNYSAVLVEHLERATVGAEASWYSGPSPYGETVRLKDHVGKVVLLDFFSFTSSGCLINAPKIGALRKELGEQGLEVIGICIDGYERKFFRGNAKQAGVDWTCISSFRSRGAIWSDWFVMGLPKYIVVGRDGRIVARDLNLEEAEAICRRELADESSTETDD